MIARIPVIWRRVAFVIYALALFAATHWPRLELNVPGIERPDLLMHFSVFGGWCVLVFASELLGPLRSFRTAAKSWGVAALCASADEAMQIPEFVHRHAAWDDLAANIGGVTLGALAACAWIAIARRTDQPNRAEPMP